MKSTLLVTLAYAAQSYAADPVCSQGVYGQIQPIFNWAPAQQFCGGNYPPSTVTVTRGRGGYYKRAPVQTTTTSSTPGKTTTPSVAASASASGSVAANANFARPVTTTSSSAADPRSSMWSSVSRGDRGVLFTFCSCIQNHPTVTVGSTTTSTASSSTRTSTTSSTSSPTTSTSTSTTSSSSSSITSTSTSTTSSSSSSITSTSTSSSSSSSTTTSFTSTTTTPACTPGPITAADGAVFNAQCNFNYYGGNTNKRSSNIITYYQGVANLASCVQSCDGTPGCVAVDYYRTAQGTGANQLAGDCFLLSNTNLGGGAANGIDAATRAAATTSTTSSTATSTSSSTSTSTSSRSTTTTSSSTMSTTSSSTSTTSSSSTSMTTSSSTSMTTSSSTSMTTSSSTSMTTSSSTTSSSSTTTSSAAATCTPGSFIAADGAIYTRQCNFNYAGGNYVLTYISAVASLEACIQQCESYATCSAVDFYRMAQGTGANQLAGDCFLLSSTAAGGAALNGVDAAFKVTVGTTTTSMTSTTSSSSTTVSTTSMTSTTSSSSTTTSTTSAVPCPTGCASGFFCDTTTPGGACRPSGNCNANAGQCPNAANCNAGGCYCQPDASGLNGYCQTGGDCGTQYCSKNSDCPEGTICFVSCCDQNFCVNPLTAAYGANNCPNPASRLFAIRGDNNKRQGKSSSAKPVVRKPSVDYPGWYGRHH